MRASAHESNTLEGNPHCWQTLFDPVAQHIHHSRGERRLQRILDHSACENRRVYRRRDVGALKSCVHWGQRKLLLSEVEFLTDATRDLGPVDVLVYAGAAPGDHLPILIQMFKGLISNWELFDETPYSWVSDTQNVIQHHQYLDEAGLSYLGAKYMGSQMVFISDIRSSDYRTVSAIENDAQILRDMELQQSWVQVLRPSRAILKFRLPYLSDSLPSLEYLSGTLHLPVWGPQSTTETRLITSGSAPFTTYDVLKYNEQMYYFNTVTRSSPHTGLKDEFRSRMSVLGLCFCFDCMSEIHILERYLGQFGGNSQIGARADVFDLSQQISTAICPRATASERTLLSTVGRSKSCSSLKSMDGRSGDDQESLTRQHVPEPRDEEAELMASLGLPSSFVGDRSTQMMSSRL